MPIEVPPQAGGGAREMWVGESGAPDFIEECACVQWIIITFISGM